MENIPGSIRKELENHADAAAQASGRRFFKEKIQLYGVRSPVVKQIGKEYFKLVNKKGKAEIFGLCESLWQSGYMEEAFIACNWSYYIRDRYEPVDFPVFRRWIEDYVDNWASCDTFCNHTMGEFIVRFPAYLNELKEFTLSENRWMRRAAAVSLIIPARKGKFHTEIFEIADALLTDKDDLVQKGYGWMLKAASQADRQAVFGYVMRNKTAMPRTALRYAIEKMPAELKARAMERQKL